MVQGHGGGLGEEEEMGHIRGIHGRKISTRSRCGYANMIGQDSRISL